eukprot:1140179-Pelagomonas_calceolata.AAC.1
MVAGHPCWHCKRVSWMQLWLTMLTARGVRAAVLTWVCTKAGMRWLGCKAWGVKGCHAWHVLCLRCIAWDVMPGM